MTKAIHPTSNAMESLFEEKITGLQLLSLFHQELRGSLAGPVWFCHTAGSHQRRSWRTQGTRNHQKEKFVPLKKKRKKTSQTPTFRFKETMGAVQLWGKLLHVTLLCTVASWVLLTQLRLAFLCSLGAWERDLPPSAKWMTEINIQHQLIVFGLKHPFCSLEDSHFLLEPLSWDAQMWPSFLHALIFLKKWYMPYVPGSKNSFHRLQW